MNLKAGSYTAFFAEECYRQSFLDTIIDGYDIAGIAKITQLKEGTVKSHLSRGKEKLANYLRKNGYDRR